MHWCKRERSGFGDVGKTLDLTLRRTRSLIPPLVLSPTASSSKPRNWATRHAFSKDITAAVIFLTLLHGGSVATALSYGFCVCGLEMAYGIDTSLFGTRRSGFVLMTLVLYSFYTAISLAHGE